jgi:hypothetical protein
MLLHQRGEIKARGPSAYDPDFHAAASMEPGFPAVQ